MKITIHQPEHMPWLGFFNKIAQADVYVILDNVQYRRRYFQNRNKIRTREGWKWIIVPVSKDFRDGLLIKDVRISEEDKDWAKDNLKTIYNNYRKAEYFRNYWREFSGIYEKKHLYLMELNLALLNFFFNALGLKKKTVLSSSLGISGKKGELILNIAKALKAKTYISGISGKDYLDFEEFSGNNIELRIQEFRHPVYQQLHRPFLPCMSVIDLLFNHGPGSLDIINGINVPLIEEVFS